MQLSLTLNVKPDADPLVVGQFLAWALRLDAGLMVTQTIAVGDISKTVTGPTSAVLAETSDEHGGDPAWTGPAPGGLTNGEAAAADTAPPAPPKKRGRPSAAASTAAQQAAALTSDDVTAPKPGNGALPPGIDPATAATVMMPPPNPGAPSGFAVPPGATTPTPPAAATPPVQQQSEPQAAMPAVPPAAAATEPGGVIALDPFKTQCMELYKAAQPKGLTAAYPFTIIRGDTWPSDGTAKFKVMSFDSVPVEFRQRVIDESMAILAMA